MKLSTRRIIALIFIIGFLISAPLLILYTAGYRYSWKKQKISQNGSLVLETQPKGASVFLNNELQITTTPLRLNNVFPNDYSIKIEKDGYYPWQKKLTVSSQQTTFAEDIILFLKSFEQVNFEQPLTILTTLDKTYSYLYFEKDDTGTKIYNYSPTDKQQAIVTTLSADEKLETFSTNKNQEYLYLQTSNDNTTNYQIIPFQNVANTINLNNKLPQITSTGIRWDINRNNTFYLFNDNQIEQYIISPNDLQLKTVHTFDKNKIILDFALIENTLYYIEQDADKIFLTKLDINDTDNEPQNRIELNYSNYKISDFINNKLLLHDQATNTFYLINKELDNIVYKNQDTLSYSYNETINKLIIYSNSEINLVDFNNGETETILRISQGISKVDWLTDNYIYFIKDKQLSIIELDKRDIRNLTTYPTENIIDIIKSKNSKNFYFSKENEAKIFELRILD